MGKIEERKEGKIRAEARRHFRQSDLFITEAIRGIKPRDCSPYRRCAPGSCTGERPWARPLVTRGSVEGAEGDMLVLGSLSCAWCMCNEDLPAQFH